MKVSEIADKLGGNVIVETDADPRAFYAGDFLSRVMGKAPSDSVWITVMGNVNVAGGAVLDEVKVVVVCEGVIPAEQLIEKCKEENIALVTTDKGVYECCRLVG